MPFVKAKDGAEIFFKDWGTGHPIVFHHGWPLSSDDWDTQTLFFPQRGYRVIAHDRRGHGRSTQTPTGHDMDTYRVEFIQGREEIVRFLMRKWQRELDYRLIKELWAFDTDRIAVQFAYEFRDDSGQWYRACGNEN